MRKNSMEYAPERGANEEELELMTPTHFELTVAHMKLSEPVANAARLCLVDGEMQTDVERKTGISQSQISVAVRSVQEKFQEILTNNEWERVEVVLPKKLVPGVVLTENFFVEPVLRARLTKKKKK